MRKAFAALVVGLALFAAISGTFALMVTASSPVEAARPCGPCPLYCQPVVCDNGHTYCNTCFARCASAKNCVPGP